MLSRTTPFFLLSLLVVFSSATQLGVRDFRFVHAVAGGGPIDVWINNVLSFTNQGFQSISEYVQRIEDFEKTTVSLVPAGRAANATIVTVCFDTPKTSSWTLIWRSNAYGSPILTYQMTQECCAAATRSSPSFSSIEFFNLDASGSFPYVIVTKNKGELFPLVRSNQITAFTELPSGTVNLDFIGPAGSIPFTLNLGNMSNYAVALWGGPSFPPVPTVVKLRTCTPKSLPLPLPAPVAPTMITYPVAVHVARQALVSLETAFNRYIAQQDVGHLIDNYFASWGVATLSLQGVFQNPLEVLPTVNHGGTIEGVKAYLRGFFMTPAHSSFGPWQVRVLSPTSFVVVHPFYVVPIPHTAHSLSRGMIHQTFTLFANQTIALTSFSFFTDIPPPPAVSLSDANSMTSLYINGLQSIYITNENVSHSFNFHYQSWAQVPSAFLVGYQLPPPYKLKACVVNFDVPSSSSCALHGNESFNLMASTLSALIPSSSSSSLEVQISQVNILSPDSFLLVFYGLVTSDVGTASVFMQHVIFSRVPDYELNSAPSFRIVHLTHFVGSVGAVDQNIRGLNAFTSNFESWMVTNTQNLLDGDNNTHFKLPYASPTWFQGLVATEFLVLPSMNMEEENLELLYRYSPYIGQGLQVVSKGAFSHWLTPLSFVFSMSLELKGQPGSPSYRGHQVMIWSLVPTPLGVSRAGHSLRIRSAQPPLINLCHLLGEKSYSCTDETDLQMCQCTARNVVVNSSVIGPLAPGDSDFRSPDLEGCGDACCLNPLCSLYTAEYMAADGNYRCLLYRLDSNVVAGGPASSGWVGMVSRPPPGVCNNITEDNVNRLDTDRALSRPARTHEQCKSSCCEDPLCNHYSFNLACSTDEDDCCFHSTILQESAIVSGSEADGFLSGAIHRVLPLPSQCALVKKRTDRSHFDVAAELTAVEERTKRSKRK